MSSSNLEKTEEVNAHSPNGDAFTAPEIVSQSDRTISVTDPENNSSAEMKKDDVPPDGGYGWVCVACVFLINAHTWGVNSVSTLSTGFQ